MALMFFLTCFGCGLLGILFHVLQGAVKQKNRDKAANLSFSIGEYLKDQILSILLSATAVFIAIILLPEIIKLRPEVLGFVRFSMVLFGFCGSSLLMAAFGAAEKKYLQIIDKKTDIADGKQ